MPPQVTILGRFPRVNFTVSTDYQGTMNDGEGGAETGFALHLFVPMAPKDAAALEAAMAASKRSEAHEILKKSMKAILPERDEAGTRARGVIAAAFK